MSIQIMTKLRRFISMAAVVAIISVFFSCKKNSTSTSNPWYFTLNVDTGYIGGGTNIITTDRSGTGSEGEVLNSTGGLFTGGESSGLGGNPGITVVFGSGCNTNATNPCLEFTATFQTLAVGQYECTNATAVNLSPINQVSLVPTGSPVQYGTAWIDSTTTIDLTITITQVGAENITGTFKGTIFVINTAQVEVESTYAYISGTFNVYRSS